MTENQPTVQNNVTIIKNFFEANGGRKVGMDEFKALSSDERKQLAEMITNYQNKK